MKKLLLLFFIITSFANAQNPLAIPPTLTGTNINLNLQNGTTTFYPGVTVNTMGANGSLLGPTLILEKDSFVNINVNNQLADTTTIHWHGMHVSPENDGGPHSIILPGNTWNPQFTILDKAGTYWYHPHLHAHTDEHVSKGIAGMILVRDTEESGLNLPMNYGVDEFPLVLQTKGFDVAGQIEIHTEMDTAVMVNGTLDAVVDFPAQVVRLRILNGSSQRTMVLGFSNNMQFSLIGTDGGLLTAPVNLTRYRIAPGQRADVLINLSTSLGQNFQLMSYGSDLPNGMYGATQPGLQTFQLIPGYTNNPLNGSDFQLLNINVTSQTASPILTIPSSLANFTRLDENTASLTRNIRFKVAPGALDLRGPFVMNDVSFDMNVINDTVMLGSTEIWSLTNQSGIAHPFHIHDVQFFILSQNGQPPAPENAGWNDVVLVPGGSTNVRFIAKFDDFASDTVPFMYHCHMLTHEDQGMMAQFIVKAPPVGVPSLITDWNNIRIYPNPTKKAIKIDGLEKIKTISIFDIAGTLIKKINVNKNISEKIVLPKNKGVYLIEITTNNGEKTIKKVVRY